MGEEKRGANYIMRKKREQKGKKVRMNQSGEDEIIRELTNVK